eukprot:Phypoly_transcript_06643.p1 GENE.Phypoly_transcript_06643~~Phypoly_transcript_06643.p1  ORF type:complete len:427 (-),score=78.07 Phypoly_transcript_06643:91-1371(-)
MDKPEEVPTTTRWTLEKEHEFRFEVDHGMVSTIQLITGTAECFGTELSTEKKYKFTAAKGAIFTWHGCTLEVSNNARGYVANETPMLMYANLHMLIDDARNQARKNSTQGPTVMLVGPTDAGKSSLAKILLGYAARTGSQPTFVDLDIGQGSITVPGALGATPVDRPIDIEEGFASGMPVAYFYGHVSLDGNPHLYRKQVALLAASIEKRKASNSEAKIAGTVINTCGWVDGLGYELLIDAIDSMKADYIAVIDHERLYNDLLQLYQKGPPGSPSAIKVIKLTKSGGVVTRPPAFRRKARMNKVREYFYGTSGDLCPHSTFVDFKDIAIYQIGGGPAAPLSALPIGAEPTIDPVQLQEVTPSMDLLHSVLAVSHADSVETINEKNVAGFIYVTDVNPEKRIMTVLAPCPGPLPSKYLIYGTLKWLE